MPTPYQDIPRMLITGHEVRALSLLYTSSDIFIKDKCGNMYTTQRTANKYEIHTWAKKQRC